MGYASYLEDIQCRLNEDLEAMSREITNINRQPNAQGQFPGLDELQKRFIGFREQCQSLLREITEILELGTIPSVDLAYELSQSRKRQLELETTITKLKADLDKTRQKLSSEKERRKKAEKQLRDIDKRLGEDPKLLEKAIDGYSDKKSIRRLKSNGC